MTRDDAVARWCLLASLVWYMEDPMGQSANDCFCMRGGFWDLKNYDGSAHGGYRNEGLALRTVERLVRKQLKGHSDRKELLPWYRRMRKEVLKTAPMRLP